MSSFSCREREKMIKGKACEIELRCGICEGVSEKCRYFFPLNFHQRRQSICNRVRAKQTRVHFCAATLLKCYLLSFHAFFPFTTATGLHHHHHHGASEYVLTKEFFKDLTFYYESFVNISFLFKANART